jgi:uncharacterized protein
VATGIPIIEDDPSDDMFLWCAMDGKADQIISSDEHLLQLQDFPVPLLSPRQLLELVENDR